MKRISPILKCIFECAVGLWVMVEFRYNGLLGIRFPQFSRLWDVAINGLLCNQTTPCAYTPWAMFNYFSGVSFLIDVIVGRSQHTITYLKKETFLNYYEDTKIIHMYYTGNWCRTRQNYHLVRKCNSLYVAHYFCFFITFIYKHLKH